MLLHLEFVPSAVGQVKQGALAVPSHATVEDPDRSAQHDGCGFDCTVKVTQRQLVDHDLAIGQEDERLLVRVLLRGWEPFYAPIATSRWIRAGSDRWVVSRAHKP